MELKSKHHWKIIVLMIFTIPATLFILILIWTMIIIDPKPIPYQIYILPCIIGALGITFLLWIIVDFKTFIIDDKGLTVKYVFHKRKLYYENKDFIGYKQYINWSGTGQYESFHLKMTSGKIFTMVDYEYLNYSILTSRLAAKTTPVEISKFHNYKLVLILFGSSVAFVTLTTLFIRYI